MKKYDVNVHCDVIIPVSVIAESEEQALEIANEKAQDMPFQEYGEFCDYTSSCVTNEREITPIMNETNNHNPELVKKVNEAYWLKTDYFDAILYILMERDKSEMEEKGIAKGDVHTYLMQVADDTDLECIINYTRVEED